MNDTAENSFDWEILQEGVALYGKSPGTQADILANLLKKNLIKTVRSFDGNLHDSLKLINDAMMALQQGKIKEDAYGIRIQEIYDNSGLGIKQIRDNEQSARLAFYEAIAKTLNKARRKSEVPIPKDFFIEASIQITQTYRSSIVRDWKTNISLQKKIEDDTEDILLRLKHEKSINFTIDELNIILLRCRSVGRKLF
jgi:hypothetical protein